MASSTDSPEPSPQKHKSALHPFVGALNPQALLGPSVQGASEPQLAQSRTSRKTLKGKSEVVWPPELEAALIEGLKKYQLDDSRETRLRHGSVPMANRFISDWIFEKTGKRRTDKQVGSRLRQLRDSGNCDKRTAMFALLSARKTSTAADIRLSAQQLQILDALGQEQSDSESDEPDEDEGQKSNDLFNN